MKNVTSTEKLSNDPIKKVMSTQYMVRVAIFSAIAFVVMYLEFPLGTLFPPYLQIDFSEAVVFIGGVVLGPAAVILMEVLKNLLHLIFRAGTGGVGELANLIVGIALILPPVMIIKKNQTIPRVILGFVVGIITMVIAASVGNYFIFLPLYKVPVEARLDMILPILMPFNAIKGVVVAFVSVLLHQSMKNIYRYIK